MKYIRFLYEVSLKDILLVGGKAGSLGELIQSGVPVPEGFVVTTAGYLNKDTELQKEIYEAFDDLRTESVAVRSSAIAEDSVNASWAGLLESYLHVKQDDVLNAIQDCWQSINSERVLWYAKQNKIPESKRAVAVIVQRMVDSDVSGVMFTQSPVTNNKNELMIEAAYGLGELLVQGEITPDNYLINKATLEIISKSKGSQRVRLVHQNGNTRKTAVPHYLQRKQTLTVEQVLDVAKLGKKIENHYRTPQDIEWAIENEALWIVQSRPITTL